jgi:hypothetical protein
MRQYGSTLGLNEIEVQFGFILWFSFGDMSAMFQDLMSTLANSELGIGDYVAELILLVALFLCFCYYVGERPCLCVSGPQTGPLSVRQVIRENMEQRWNNTDRGTPTSLVKNLPHCSFICHKSHIDSPGSESEPPR